MLAEYHGCQGKWGRDDVGTVFGIRPRRCARATVAEPRACLYDGLKELLTRCLVIETLRWWLAATVIGLIATPYAFRLFQFLPDRGYTIARILGIVLVVFPLWLLSVLGVLTYTAGSAALVLAVLGVSAIILAGRDRHALAAHLRAHAGMVITAEVVFATVLVGIALLRAYAPAIDATEKLFELGMLEGVLRSPRMPPADPWFGGEPLSYYYGGYLVTALFIKLTGVTAAYGFNLGVALTGALAALATFGLGANLTTALIPRRYRRMTRAHTLDATHAPTSDGVEAAYRTDEAGVGAARRVAQPASRVPPRAVAGTSDGVADRVVDSSSEAARHDAGSPLDAPGNGAEASPGTSHRTAPTAVIAGLLGVALLMVIGNLEGAVELASAHGWGEPSWYQRLGIVNLTGLVRTEHWYPDEYWFWWRATRLGSDWNILEFPFFSFMLGDLHAHVMVLPFTLLGLAAVFNLLAGGQPLDITAVRRRPLTVLFLGVVAGMLAMSNSWDQPVFLLLLFAAALVLNISSMGASMRALVQAVAFTAPVAVLSFALFIPFFLYLRPATEGIVPIELLHPPPGIEGEAMVSPPHHFLLAWGPLLLIAGSGIIGQAMRRRIWRAPGATWLVAFILAGSPLLAWAIVVTAAHGSPGALVDEVRARATWWAFGSYWIVQFGVLGLCLIGGVTLYAQALRPHPERRAARTYLLLSSVAGLLVLHVIELFYVLEPSPSRINTLFKFSFIVWLLLASAGGAFVIDVLVPWWRGRARLGPVVWASAVVGVLSLALVYPFTAAMNRTNGFTSTPTLDGLAFLRAIDPDEYAAMVWMGQNLPGRPLVLEAAGENYSAAGRVSARTGFPTVIGWLGHQKKLRGGRDYQARERLINARAADVATIYRTPDSVLASALLRRYGVDYVYLGRLELQQYGPEGAAKFEGLGRPVFRNASVAIYQVGEDAVPLGSRR